MEIHVLHQQSRSFRAITKALHVSRNTVRKFLRDIAKTPVCVSSQKPDGHS